jgi:hypothetical protein
MKKSLCLVLILFVFNCVSISGQQPNVSAQNSELPKPATVYRQELAKNNYLAPLLQLRKRETEYLADARLRESYLEYMTQLYDFVGDYRMAYAMEEKFLADLEPRIKFRARNAKEITSSPLENYSPRSAVAAISAAADKHQIVIVNEEHRTPVHRALTHRLLSALYRKGFRYLAVETLRVEDTELNKRGYPTQKSGYYTFDPIFGDVIRQAIKLGFKTVAYEAEQRCPKPEEFIACQNYREVAQAQNIYDRILKNDRQAKILIHAGRGHASKGKEENGFAFMGRHLWNISGIEPFTVDQEDYSERKNPVDERPLYRLVTAKNFLLKEPTVFQSPEGKFFSDSDGYDLRVFTPRAQYAGGRPNWLPLGGTRRSFRMNLKKLNLQTRQGKLKSEEPLLLQAFFKHEGADAIPVDQIILYPNKEIPVLLLPKGSFIIRAIDETGKVIGRYEKRVMN